MEKPTVKYEAFVEDETLVIAVIDGDRVLGATTISVDDENEPTPAD